jgi:hypothetical protein
MRKIVRLSEDDLSFNEMVSQTEVVAKGISSINLMKKKEKL